MAPEPGRKVAQLGRSNGDEVVNICHLTVYLNVKSSCIEDAKRDHHEQTRSPVMRRETGETTSRVSLQHGWSLGSTSPNFRIEMNRDE